MRSVPLTAKAELSAAMKRARDIMRRDAGPNGDLDRKEFITNPRNEGHIRISTDPETQVFLRSLLTKA